jgi:hypothetical protein
MGSCSSLRRGARLSAQNGENRPETASTGRFQPVSDVLPPVSPVPTPVGVAAKSFDLSTKSFDLSTKSFDLSTKSVDLSTKSVDLCTKSVDLCTKSVDLCTKSADLSTKSVDLSPLPPKQSKPNEQWGGEAANEKLAISNEQWEDFRRESLDEAEEAVVSDSETAFSVRRTPRVGVSYRLFALNQRVFAYSLPLLIAHCEVLIARFAAPLPMANC